VPCVPDDLQPGSFSQKPASTPTHGSSLNNLEQSAVVDRIEEMILGSAVLCVFLTYLCSLWPRSTGNTWSLSPQMISVSWRSGS
jgi:hypothetical protein